MTRSSKVADHRKDLHIFRMGIGKLVDNSKRSRLPHNVGHSGRGSCFFGGGLTHTHMRTKHRYLKATCYIEFCTPRRTKMDSKKKKKRAQLNLARSKKGDPVRKKKK